MIVPAIKTEGVFSFSSPFNTEELNNKFYRVDSIRMLREIHKNEQDPLNSIYLPQGLTEEDFKEDLEQDIPIIGFNNQGTRLIYVPADRIVGTPKLSGIKYERKMINVSLGLLPETYPLDGILENIVDVVKDGLGIIPATKVSTNSSKFLKSDEEHNEFLSRLSAHPRVKVFKSYKQKYLELKEEFDALKLNHETLTDFMCKTWQQNVTFTTEVPPQVKQVMAKKIIIDAVSYENEKPFCIDNLLFGVCSPIGNTRANIYAKGFTVKDPEKGKSYYGVLGNTRMTIEVTEGDIDDSHLPYLFSINNTVMFKTFEKKLEPVGTKKVTRCSITIHLDEPLYITYIKMRAYHTEEMYIGTCRFLIYNEENKLVYNTIFENNRDYNAVSPYIDKDIKEGLQINSSIPHPLPDPS